MNAFPSIFDYKWLILFLLIGWMVGCSSTPKGADTFMGEGFRTSLPPPGTRVVIWGNHNGALTRTSGWLHEQGLQVIDRSWVEKELKDPALHLRSRPERHAQVLEAAKSADAELVVFAYVEENQLGRKFDLSSMESQRMTLAWVEVRGVEIQTGAVVFGAKAWNSEAMVASEESVLKLTTLALQKAWTNGKYPQSSPVEVVVQERSSVQVDSSSEALKGTTLSDPQEIVIPQQRAAVREESGIAAESGSPAPSQNAEDPSWGLQAASGALSILYAPLKIVYAGMGGFVGGVAYLLTAGNVQTAQTIWDASLEGTYWLTPAHLQGREPIQFKGEPTSVDVAHHRQVPE